MPAQTLRKSMILRGLGDREAQTKLGLDPSGPSKNPDRNFGNSVDYCDRQGCLQPEAGRRILPDGYEVGVCERHLIHFDGAAAGAYFHACTVKD